MATHAQQLVEAIQNATEEERLDIAYAIMELPLNAMVHDQKATITLMSYLNGIRERLEELQEECFQIS